MIIEQIDRDVHRTHPDIDFFSGDSQYAKSNQVYFLAWFTLHGPWHFSDLVLTLLFPGGYEEYIDCICKVKSWHKIRTRNE